MKKYNSFAEQAYGKIMNSVGGKTRSLVAEARAAKKAKIRKESQDDLQKALETGEVVRGKAQKKTAAKSNLSDKDKSVAMQIYDYFNYKAQLEAMQGIKAKVAELYGENASEIDALLADKEKQVKAAYDEALKKVKKLKKSSDAVLERNKAEIASAQRMAELLNGVVQGDIMDPEDPAAAPAEDDRTVDDYEYGRTNPMPADAQGIVGDCGGYDHLGF